MKRLNIKNFGPISEACLDLGQVNVIIGQQSSGKSCVLKTACYCAWVEKRIELTQSDREFCEGSEFIDRMVKYYNMTGYLHDDTFIEYETSHLRFSYNNSSKSFKLNWKSSRWNYKKPKISYIPADRNLVAAIPVWSSMPLDDNLLEFMANWDNARKFIEKEEDVLGLGMSYIYDKKSNSDQIQLKNGVPLLLKEGSSGIQSLFPMYVHLDYMTSGIYRDDSAKLSYARKEEQRKLLEILYNKFNKPILLLERSDRGLVDDAEFQFQDSKEASNFKRVLNNYTLVHHSEIFLEEPEDNLFPPTQIQLVNWLVATTSKHKDLLFVATHSPYILDQFIKADPNGLTVFFTHRVDDDSQMCTVRKLDKDEIREVYENGVDLFFNFEAYV